MTDLQRAAMQAALEALGVATTPLARGRQEVLRAQAALRAALAEEPRLCAVYVPEGWKLVPTQPTAEMLAATSWPGCAATDYAHMIAAAPMPPRREWVGLTNEERQRILDTTHPDNRWTLAERVEYRLKERNA